MDDAQFNFPWWWCVKDIFSVLFILKFLAALELKNNFLSALEMFYAIWYLSCLCWSQNGSILNLFFTYGVVLHVPLCHFGEQKVGSSCWLWRSRRTLCGCVCFKHFFPKNGSGGLYVCLQSTRLEDLCKIPDYICISNKEPATRHVGTYSQQVMKWEGFSWVGGSVGWIQSLNALML